MPGEVATCYQDGVDDDVGLREETGRLGMGLTAEAEDGRRGSERLG